MKCGVPCPHSFAGEPCRLDAGHAGLHSWPTEIDMESYLPVCECGKKRARCGCPVAPLAGATIAHPAPHNAMIGVPAPFGRGPSRWTQISDKRPRDSKWCPAHAYTYTPGCPGCGAPAGARPGDDESWLLDESRLPRLFGVLGREIRFPRA